MAVGELMRFLAEAAWYPTALLPREGVRWVAVDDTSAVPGWWTAPTRSLSFFGSTPKGRSTRYGRTRALGRPTVRGPHPLGGPFWGHERGTGCGADAGEVAWLLPEGRLPYWRGRVTAISYDLAQ